MQLHASRRTLHPATPDHGVLQESGGDRDAAKAWLRNKGMGQADKKAGRVAAEGAIVSYIHTGAQLGVLAEVNCETDFVARGEPFKNFADDVALQIAAADSTVSVVKPEEVTDEMLAKDKEIEMGREDLQDKPQERREMIVKGRLDKIRKSQARGRLPAWAQLCTPSAWTLQPRCGHIVSVQLGHAACNTRDVSTRRDVMLPHTDALGARRVILRTLPSLLLPAPCPPSCPLAKPQARVQALMAQPYVRGDGGKDDLEVVRKRLIADVGENVNVRRFVRFELGAGLEDQKKGDEDFAAEVAKQTEALKEAAPTVRTCMLQSLCVLDLCCL